MQGISGATLSQFRWFGPGKYSHADLFWSSLILSRVRSQLKQLLLWTTLGLGFGVVAERVALRSALPAGVLAH
jgi:hypothetical protein